MALINCAECLKEISDQAKFCPHCGYPLKKKGKGLAVASLVLGIIGCVYSLPTFAATLETTVTTNAAISMSIYIMIFGILSLIFGIASHNKGCKLKKKIAGIVLSIFNIVILSLYESVKE